MNSLSFMPSSSTLHLQLPSHHHTASNTNQLSLTSVKRKRNEVDYDDPFTSLIKKTKNNSNSSQRNFLRHYPLPYHLLDYVRMSSPGVVDTSIPSNYVFQLLSTGDLLVFAKKDENLIIFRNFYEKLKDSEVSSSAGVSSLSAFSSSLQQQQQSPLIISFPIPWNEVKFTDVLCDFYSSSSGGSNVYRRKEVLLITEAGLLIFIDLLGDRDEGGEPIIQRIHLNEEKEEKLIDYAIHSFNSLLFLSNLGEVYIVERSFSASSSRRGVNEWTMTADKLNRSSSSSSNMLFGLVKSILGFSSSSSSSTVSGSASSSYTSASTKYSHLLLLKDSTSASLALTIGTNLTLWSSYLNLGNEKIVYDYEHFSSDIKRDIMKALNEQSDRESLRISFLQVDKVISSASSSSNAASEEEGSNMVTKEEKIVLMILTAASSSSMNAEGEVSLWLHLVEIPLSPSPPTSPYADGPSVDVIILHRILISNTAVFSSAPSDAGTSVAAISPMNPMMYTMPPYGWRIFLSWFAASASTGSSFRSLHSLQIDIFNIIAMTKQQHQQQGSTSQNYSFSDYSRHSLDTKISQHSLLLLKSVNNVDGIVGIVSGLTLAAVFYGCSILSSLSLYLS
jgi:hypothetical protein